MEFVPASRSYGTFTIELLTGGCGRTPVLHGEEGLRHDRSFLLDLAEEYAVTAPHHSGFAGSNRRAPPHSMGELINLYLYLLRDVSRRVLLLREPQPGMALPLNATQSLASSLVHGRNARERPDKADLRLLVRRAVTVWLEVRILPAHQCLRDFLTFYVAVALCDHRNDHRNCSSVGSVRAVRRQSWDVRFDREISSANRLETRLDAIVGSCQAERRGTN